MARTRNIKPAFFDNDILGGMQPLTRLLFIGLWCIADRDGRLEDRPRRIKKTLLGYDDVTAEETDGMLRELENGGFIIRYEVDGEAYIQIVNFSKHQNPHIAEKMSEIPAPSGFTTSIPKSKKSSKDTAPKTHAPELADWFEEFWTAYPKRRNRAQAEREWFTLNPKRELVDTILAALQTFIHSEEWNKENGRYIPNPARWLADRRWQDDEIPAPKNSTQNALDDIIDSEGGIDV